MRERVLEAVQVLDVAHRGARSSCSRAPRTSRRSHRRCSASGSSLSPPRRSSVGTLIRYRLKLQGIPVSWLTRIEAWDPPHGFVDRQLKGPYGSGTTPTRSRRWRAVRTLMTDIVRYAHRFGPLGTIAEHLVVRRDLDRIFDLRRDTIPGLLPPERGSETQMSLWLSH